MMFARTSFSIDPAWPGSGAGLGVGTLTIAAVLLVVITVWTYLGSHTAWRRLILVLTLRLLALAVTVLLLLRPSLAFEEEEPLQPSRLLILVDHSKSMFTQDEFNHSGRLVNAHRILGSDSVRSSLRRLAEDKKVEILLYQGADEVVRYDQEATADGKATDIARWLTTILRDYGRDANVQGLFLLSDGIDTGDSARTLQKAAEFRGRFPLHTFALGQPTGGSQDKDVALDRIFIDPQPILAKGKFTARVIARAAGYENERAEVSLWIEDPTRGGMKKIKSSFHRFTAAAEQEISIEGDAPDRDGEVMITVKVGLTTDPLKGMPGETVTTNNEISTFENVSKEGVRILWVEGQRRWEFVIPIRESLRKDRRFQVVEDLRGRDDGPVPPGPNDLDNKVYDVLVIGDISAQRFSRGNPAVFDTVFKLVQDRGMGLLMLGGYQTFGNGGWQTTPLERLLPVKLDRTNQIEGKVGVVPTREGLQYVLKLADDPKRNAELWSKVLDPLDGITEPGALQIGASALLTREGDPNLPVLASVTRGKGRVMTFAGDTTWKVWRRTPDARAAFDRFWKQMMLWLAQQENTQGNVFVKLDARRIDRGRNPTLGYEAGFRGAIVTEPRFTAKIVGPDKQEYPVALSADARGTWQPPAVGIYTMIVNGKGTTTTGTPIEGTASARFLVTEEDREGQRVAADHDFLEKLAAAGGGRFARAEERTVIQRLEELQANRSVAVSRVSHWPDWRRTPAGDTIGDQFSALWRSSALLCLTCYIVFLCLEWFLRRRWGLV